jgi:hypothetical protein
MSIHIHPHSNGYNKPGGGGVTINGTVKGGNAPQIIVDRIAKLSNFWDVAEKYVAETEQSWQRPSNLLGSHGAKMAPQKIKKTFY